MIKSYAARKFLMKNPNATAKEVSDKFKVHTTDVYQFKKQINQAKEPNSPITILPNGRLIKRLSATVAPTATEKPTVKLGRPRKETVMVDMNNVVSKFVEKLNLDYKHAYALELLVKGEVKKADQVLTD